MAGESLGVLLSAGRAIHRACPYSAPTEGRLPSHRLGWLPHQGFAPQVPVIRFESGGDAMIIRVLGSWARLVVPGRHASRACLLVPGEKVCQGQVLSIGPPTGSPPLVAPPGGRRAEAHGEPRGLRAKQGVGCDRNWCAQSLSGSGFDSRQQDGRGMAAKGAIPGLLPVTGDTA